LQITNGADRDWQSNLFFDVVQKSSLSHLTAENSVSINFFMQERTNGKLGKYRTHTNSFLDSRSRAVLLWTAQVHRIDSRLQTPI